MSKQICLVDATDVIDTELIGKTVYFEAKKTLKVGNNRPRGPNWRGSKPYYDLIPGTVLAHTPRGVVIEGAGKGIYNRTMADIVRPEDLDRWLRNNPLKLVLRGEA